MTNQCPACAALGVKTILGYVDHRHGRVGGTYTPEESAHYDAGREHFLKHCDSGKCIRGQAQSLKCNWHDNGFCLECAFNPYNMIAGEGEK